LGAAVTDETKQASELGATADAATAYAAKAKDLEALGEPLAAIRPACQVFADSSRVLNGARE
jgi:hypothetical protein